MWAGSGTGASSARFLGGGPVRNERKKKNAGGCEPGQV